MAWALIEKVKDVDEHWKILTNSILLVLGCGVFPSLLYSDWGWLSRSGSILIIYGGYIVWLDYKGNIDSDLSKIESLAVKNGDKDADLLAVVRGIRTSNKKLYKNINLVILVFGTVIWGYGDLVEKLWPLAN